MQDFALKLVKLYIILQKTRAKLSCTPNKNIYNVSPLPLSTKYQLQSLQLMHCNFQLWPPNPKEPRVYHALTPFVLLPDQEKEFQNKYIALEATQSHATIT